MKNPLHILASLIAMGLIMSLSAGTAKAASGPARVDVILVQAGNGGEGVDRSLRPYARTLQRLFRFKSYQQAGRRTARVDVPGETTVPLAGGQTLSLRTMRGGESALRAEVNWLRGSKRLLHTRIHLKPGVPAVLGGPRSGDGTWLLILVLK